MEYNVNKFKQLVLKENQKQNLISRKTVDEDIDKHILDCQKIYDFIDLRNLHIADIGSGAGFPGLVLAIMTPNATITLVESDLKKSQFLSLVVEHLNLSNVNIIRERVEIVGQDKAYREQFDICTSRAVAAMNIMLEYSVPLVKNDGIVMLWKGRNYEQEILEANNALDELSAKVTKVYKYNLLEDRDRAIVEVKKQQATLSKYPRRVGIPAKRPL